MHSVILFILSTIILSVHSDLGDVCQTNQGQNGICSKVEQCDQALQDLKRNVHPTICGFRGKETYVCCGFNSSYIIGDIAKEKCEEYLTLSTHRKFDAHGIIGGVKSASTEFPHMVALGYGDESDIKWNCGGSLISENYVLTAAHCLYSPNDGDVRYIRAGTVTLANPEYNSQNFKVARRVPHPDYVAPISYHDIALIKLDKPIVLTRNVKPACLQTSFDIKGNISALGWGYLYHGGNQSNDLMKVDLVQYSYSQCKTAYSRDVRNLPNGVQERFMLCAGGKENEERDTCQGDSGGPLQITQRYQTIVGITSFGKICGTPNFPGVYTRVSNYIDWIENVVWK